MRTLLLDPSCASSTPWRNGAGATRELATANGPDGTTSWRISLADLDHDASFSCFLDTDRLLVALGPMRLEIDGRVHVLGTGDQVRFPGEARVAVSLAHSSQALNVMTRRHAWSAEVTLRAASALSRGAHATVLLDRLAADVRLVHSTKETDA